MRRSPRRGRATVQTCIVHLIRRSAELRSYNDRKAMAGGAEGHLHRVRCGRGVRRAGRHSPARRWGRSTRPRWRSGNGPGTGSSRSWNSRPRCGRCLYTTNAIESFNREMRKVLKTRTQFPNDDAVVKTLWLAILDIEEKRAEQRAKQARECLA